MIKIQALPSKKIGVMFRTIVKNTRKLFDYSKMSYWEYESECAKIYGKYYDASWEGKLSKADKIKSIALDGNFLRGMQFAFGLVRNKVDLDLKEIQVGPLYFHSYGAHVYLFQGSEEDIIDRLKKGQQEIRELMRSAAIVNG